MTAKDIFGLFVRLLAFMILAYGFYVLLFSFIEAAGLIEKVKTSASTYAATGIFMIVFGAAILFFADLITAFAYPLPRPSRPEE